MSGLEKPETGMRDPWVEVGVGTKGPSKKVWKIPFDLMTSRRSTKAEVAAFSDSGPEKEIKRNLVSELSWATFFYRGTIDRIYKRPTEGHGALKSQLNQIDTVKYDPL